jgi:hypothetical protein
VVPAAALWDVVAADDAAEAPPVVRPPLDRPPAPDTPAAAVVPVAAPLAAVAAPAALLPPAPWADVPDAAPVPVVVADPEVAEFEPAALDRDVPLWPVVVWTTPAEVYPGACGFEPSEPSYPELVPPEVKAAAAMTTAATTSAATTPTMTRPNQGRSGPPRSISHTVVRLVPDDWADGSRRASPDGGNRPQNPP